jgi:hypothetical protein
MKNKVITYDKGLLILEKDEIVENENQIKHKITVSSIEFKFNKTGFSELNLNNQKAKDYLKPADPQIPKDITLEKTS